MQRVNFTYPGAAKQTLFNITIQCSLSSRVAVIGPNGAGKSTMIKLLTGELEAEEGLVWKHPNLRVAYVAQHAFHHVEQHLDMTPNEYIRWRYAFGEDREEQEKVSRKLKEEDEKKMAEKVVIDGTKKVVDCLLGRRKLKKSYEYEVQWVGGIETSWLSRDQ
jgi:elongation factor 3